MIKTALASALLLSLLPAHALTVTSPSFTYAQNFDSLATSGTANAWANDSTLAGWSLFLANGLATPATYLATNTNAGGFKSLGSDADRAFGATGSGGAYYGTPAIASGAIAGWFAVSFSNATGSALSGFTLGFDGEQWANGGNTSAHTLVLEYGFGSTFASVGSWVAPGGSFDFVSPVIGGTAFTAVDGNVAGKVTGLGGTVTTAWASGDTLWVRWVERNDVGNDHTLAIDNLSFSVSAVPEPGAMSLLLAGIAGVGFVVRRRKA